MDKNAIKKFAVWARTELIDKVKAKAQQYGVEKDNIINENADEVYGRVLSKTEKTQRKALIYHIKENDYERVMEEIAYTWFNRFCALRFMEVNSYLPDRIRVFTNDNDEFEPQIMTEAIDLEIDGLDMDKVFEYKNTNNKEELYKYLLTVQCNALGKIMPGMFHRISSYAELLLPDRLLNEGSVIDRLIQDISVDDWTEGVQIVGWMYQYWNTEPKDKVFADLKKNIKITKENIPAATQLFTPDWIVSYMVENSLGRLWFEGHPDFDKSEWKYYLDEAEQTEEVQAQLDEIRKEYANIKPEEIKCIDPCMGSGHILCTMFDVLMQIYDSYGYQPKDAVESIIINNIYGLDIDERAKQLAYFSVMMKAVQYDKRFLKREYKQENPALPQPNVYSFQNLHVDCDDINNESLKKLAVAFKDADEFGSLTEISDIDYDKTAVALDDFEEDLTTQDYKEKLSVMYKLAEILNQKYDVVCTNPPYMGGSGMNATLSDFVKKNFPDSKSDLFSCYMEKAYSFAKVSGYTSLITMESWMFLSSFEKLRQKINTSKTIINMVHMPYLGKGGTSLGINFGTAAVITKNSRIANYSAQYEYTVYYETDDEGVPFVFPTINERWKTAKQENFSKIPGSPVAYWVSENFIRAFENKKLSDYALARNGMKTGDNGEFVRIWWEVTGDKIGLELDNYSRAIESNKKWFPYNKGGEYRKWYGNNDCIVNWENGGQRVIGNAKQEKRNVQDYPIELKFKPLVTWSLITSSTPSFRYKEYCINDIAGMSFWDTSNLDMLYYLLGICNCKFAFLVLKMIAPTINFQAGDIARIPILCKEQKKEIVDTIVEQNITLSKTDWDSFETSWDFEKHPILNGENTIEKAFKKWSVECENRFNTLKANEEELNRIFIDIYGLQDELTPEVEDKDVTVRKVDLQRDIKSLISYAVGCMFGRYSLDTDGLAYAGGEWDESKYTTFIPDKDNIIPICDDEYFKDDVVGLFVKFIEKVYGVDTLEENLRFIADALGGKGTPKDVIRNYFLNDFYADHCKTYQKRPIYWLFDSGKKNGFKCLIYMHRYRFDTVMRIRTDYVHEQQSRYRTAIEDLQQRLTDASTSERVKLNKQLSKIQAQADEIHEYEEKIHHLADKQITIDLDDGVKNNYELFKDVLSKIK